MWLVCGSKCHLSHSDPVTWISCQEHTAIKWPWNAPELNLNQSKGTVITGIQTDIFSVVQAKFQQGRSNDGIYHKEWMRWTLYWIYLWIVCTTRLRPAVFGFKQWTMLPLLRSSQRYLSKRSDVRNSLRFPDTLRWVEKIENFSCRLHIKCN